GGQRGDLRKGHDLAERDDLAVHEAALDLKTVVELLGEVVDDPGRGHGVVVADSQGRGAVQQPVQLAHAAVVDGEAQQGVLHHGVVHVVLAQLGAQGGVLRNGDAPVVHQHTGGGAL